MKQEMDREQRNAAFRKIALEKLHCAHSRSHKLSSKSLVKLQKLDSLFEDQNRRLKSDTLVKVISEVNKLIAEIAVWTELEHSRIVDPKQLTSLKTIVQSAPLQQSPSDASALYPQKDFTPEERYVHENSSKCRSDSLNAEMDKLLLKEISQIASDYDADKCPAIKNNDNEERLALKYPRKKIDSIDQPAAFKIPEIPSKRSTAPLYWRRDQIFSKPEAAKTYGEYKRQQQMAAAAERQKASTSPIQEDKSGGVFGSSGVRAVKPAFTSIPVDRLLRNEIDVSREVASVVGGKEATTSVTTSSSNNVLDASMHRNENSVRLAHSDKRESHIFTTPKTTSGKAASSSAPQSDVSEHFKNLAEENTREITDKSTTKTDPQKKNQTKKKVYNRELNDIILGAVEYGCNSRRKQENDKLKNVVMQPKGTQESEGHAGNTEKLLNMQKMCKDFRIVLTRIDENDLPIARRTRSKSTDNRSNFALHKPAEDCTMQDDMQSRKARRKSVDSRTQLETSRTSQTLTKGRKNRAKSMWCKRTNHKDTGKRANSFKKKKDVSPIRKLHDNSSNKLTEDEADRDSNMYLSDTEDGAIIIQPLTKKCRKANDNDKVHCQSKFMFNCCLCEYSGSNMVDHYVSKHPDQEVFISRVSPDQADVIRKQPSALHGKCVTLGQVRRSISCICFFCEIVYVLTPNEWIEHIARHTGEFVYCNDSKNMINVNSDIEFSSNHMYAHICDRCNFVQVSSTNMKKHFSTHHSSDHQHVEEYIRFSLVNYHTESEGEHDELLDASICTKLDSDLSCDIVNLPLSVNGVPYDIETTIASQQPASDLCYFQESIVKEEVHFDESLEEDNRFGTERNCNGMSVLQDVGNGDNFDSHSMVSADSGRTIDMPGISNVKPDIATIENDIDGQPNEKEPLNYDSDDSRCTIPMDETYFNERTKIKVEDALDEQIPLSADQSTDNCSGNQSPAIQTAEDRTTSARNAPLIEPHEDESQSATMEIHKTIVCTEAFAIRKIDTNLIYVCLYLGCCSVASNVDKLRQHVETKHAHDKWGGFCHTCCRLVRNTYNSPPLFVVDQLQHFLEQHTESTKTQSQQKIRLRKLPGDLLSGAVE
ncbi:uncharacterized protein LOC131206605 [Anopheles bellator]|uniref:uncharacterized protein LOC131206605 n=1 Tax=Anopheles bellator TaxID=139047 RepID=UPI0026472C44|nr:uncharacterized protein LOC131206605 [Anopheles bellator]